MSTIAIPTAAAWTLRGSIRKVFVSDFFIPSSLPGLCFVPSPLLRDAAWWFISKSRENTLRICRFQRIAVNYPKYTIEYPCLTRTFSKLFVKKCYGIRSGGIAWLPFQRIKTARLFAPMTIHLIETCPTGCSKSAKTYRLTICCTECSEYYLQIRGGLAIMAYKRTSLII